MKIYDEEGLKRAVARLDVAAGAGQSQRHRDRVRRRRIGLHGASVVAAGSIAVLVATWFVEPPLPRALIIPVVLGALGAIVYLFAAHADGFSNRSMAEQLRSSGEFFAEVGATARRLPALAILLIVACVIGVGAAFATAPGRSRMFAVQDSHGYWLEDGSGTRLRPMSEEEFRRFGIQSDRPLACISLAFSVIAGIGFAYGPGSPRKSSDVGR
jgi:ferric-dicitrate binding protein FerR (iron transport regulator)